MTGSLSYVSLTTPRPAGQRIGPEIGPERPLGIILPVLPCTPCLRKRLLKPNAS